MIRQLAALAVRLPTRLVKCRRCGGELRGRQLSGDTVIICDRCEYFTSAPSTHKQLIDDLIGAELRNAIRSN